MAAQPISRVLISSASPDHANRNAAMRGYVAAGFGEILGSAAVGNLPLHLAPAAIARDGPELVVCFGSCMPDASGFAQLRHACDRAGATLAFWLHDDPYEFDFRYKVLDVADFVFSNDRWAALHYEHPRAAHLPMAASRTAHWRPVRTDKSMDVFFCGVAFENRKRLAADLARVLARHRTRFLGDGWPVERLPFTENRRLGNAELADHYAGARVTLNMGRDLDLANRRYQLCPSTPGPRTFEAAMAGAAQMFFVEGLEIADYFEPDREIVLFDSVREFEQRLTELLDAPERAAAIGAAAQRRALAEHCYAHRARRILDTVGGTDPAR